MDAFGEELHQRDRTALGLPGSPCVGRRGSPGNQHRPQVVRWALGWHRLGRLGLGWEWIVYAKCAGTAACAQGGVGYRAWVWRWLA